MQGPHAEDLGEEVTGPHRMLVGLRDLDTTANILHLSLNVCPCLKKRQKQYNQIKEVNKAKSVSDSGGKTQNTFPLCTLGKRKKCFLRPPERCQDVRARVKPRKISHLTSRRFCSVGERSSG